MRISKIYKLLTLFQNNPSKKYFSGFTLIEILFVVIMIGVIFGLSVPALNKRSSDFSIIEESRNILSLSIYARQRAVSESVVYRLNIDEDLNSYYLSYRNTIGNFTESEDKYGRPRKLGSELKIKSDKPFVDFYPDSKVDQAKISLENLKGKTINLESRPFLGDMIISKE